MPLVNAVWYYSSAKPESGYSAAVRGYAHKLAHALKAKPHALASDDPTFLREYAATHGVARVIIGVQQSVELLHSCVQTGQAPLLLKARPYADQHGQGISMHARTQRCLQQAKQQAQSMWPAMEQSAVFVCVANPHWLADKTEQTAQLLWQWLKQSGASSLMLSNSPRSNPLVWPMFQDAMTQHAEPSITLHCNTFDSPYNHYLPMLSMADAVVVLGSSRSMASEAALTCAPIYYLPDQPSELDGFLCDSTALLPPNQQTRFRPVAWQAPIVFDRYAPYDVTQHYVHQALAQLNAPKVA